MLIKNFFQNQSPRFFIFFILILLSFASQLTYAKSYKDEPYRCQGIVKTLFMRIPLDLTVRESSLSWIWKKQWFTTYEEKGTYEFDVQYANGFFISKIDSNKLSVQLNHIKGTLFIDQCILELPVEKDTIEGLFKLKSIFPNLFE